MWPFQDGSHYTRGHFRWRFADEYNRKELELKQKTIAKLEKFWSEFQKRGEELSQKYQPTRGASVVEFVQKNLLSIENGIMWECGPDKPSGMTMEFTAESTRHLRPIVLTLLEMAPTIPGWRFAEFRFPLPIDMIESGFQGKLRKELYPFTVHCETNPANGINITFSSPLFKGDDVGEDLGDMFLLTEMVLGEKNLDVWMDFVSTKKSSEPIGQHPLAVAREFFEDFENKKQTILKSLPDSPYHTLPPMEETTLATLAEDPQSVPRWTVAYLVPSFLAGICEASRFNSERLSKCGERFGYLQFSGDESYLDVDKRGALEDQIDKKLRDAQVGIKAGAGMGIPSTIFVDLCLHDVDAAIPVLREVCRELKLPQNAKLRFYDADWVHEWVGMYPDTAAPLDTTKLWRM